MQKPQAVYYTNALCTNDHDEHPAKLQINKLITIQFVLHNLYHTLASIVTKYKYQNVLTCNT